MSGQGWRAERRARAALVLATVLLGSCAAKSPDRPAYLGPKPPDPVRRVATLAPALSETVIALGAGDRLVGVSRFDDLPRLAALPRLGGYTDPSVEAVVALGPDLLLVSPAPGNRQAVEKIAGLGIPVLLLPADDIVRTYAAIRETGKALGLGKEAEAIIEDLDATRARIRGLARSKKPPRVLILYGFEPLVAAGRGSFADELLIDAGGINVVQGLVGSFPKLPVESAVRSRPEVVIDCSMTSAGVEKFRALPGISQARWVELRTRELMQPGPSLGVALEALYRAVHDPDPGHETPGHPERR